MSWLGLVSSMLQSAWAVLLGLAPVQKPAENTGKVCSPHWIDEAILRAFINAECKRLENGE